MLRRADQRAEDILADARRQATELVARAQRAGEAELIRAREQGAEQAAPLAAAERSRSRHRARSAVLDARLVVRDQLAGQIRAAVCALRNDPDYPLWRERLAGLAARAAGPAAAVTEHPEGGVVARSAGVVVDCSLPRLADRAVDALGSRIAGMCDQ
jgi:hypothetical protein